MILSDNETKVDLLNNEPIAKTIVALLRKHPDHPITIGVHGDWGAGKSSILEMIEAELSEQDRVLCLKFNGWRFQGFEDAKIALIEGIVTGLLDKRPLLTKATASVKEIFRRIDLLKLAKRAGGLAVAAYGAYTGNPHLGIAGLVGTLEGTLSDPANFTKENVQAAITGAKDLLKDGSHTTNVPDEIAGFRKAFDDLLKDAGIDQLIVLIDDLDRCLPDTAIETLEAVRLFVFTSRTAFVVAADEAMIEYAVRKHFPDLVWSKISNALKRLGFQSHNFLAQLLSETSRACTIRVRRSTLERLWNELGSHAGLHHRHRRSRTAAAERISGCGEPYPESP